MDITVTVAKKSREAEDIVSLELVPNQGSRLPTFDAGAHIDVHLPNGLIRQYSLCNPLTEQHRYVIGVLRDPQSRGGSVFLHDQVAPGDTLRISEPRNLFPLDPSARHSLLLAAGIGVTPILAMAEHLATLGQAFELHYCCRTWGRLAFADRIALSRFADKVYFHLDDGQPEQRFNARAVLGEPKPEGHVYVCGPTGFLDHVLETARTLSWEQAHIHREDFSATPTAAGADGTFEVKIASTGRILTIPADESVVSVLQKHGIDVPLSCEQGICGTCLTRVLEGIPDHRDMFMTDDEHARNDQFTPCCSRSKSSRLVLDL